MDKELQESKEKKLQELAKDAIKKAGEKETTRLDVKPPKPPGPSTHSVAKKKKTSE